MANLTGQSIGRYHILEQLGEGGMATVYKAYDTRLERNVAFKVLRTEQFSPVLLEQVLQRFEREAKSLARLSHPNIVNILDYGEHEDSPFLVMEFLPVGTLKQKLGQAIPWQQAFHILLPIARGLAYAHQHNLIHRDVKPANILMGETNRPILTDFGIAKLLEGAEGHTLTGSGVGIGTPEYMAPEQGLGANVIDARADIYSMGIVLFEMVTGRKPYIADTPMAVVLKQMTDPLPRPTDYAPDLPEGVEHILFKALSKQPEDRYADVDALIEAMEGVLAEAQKAETQVVPVPAQVEQKASPRLKPSPKMVMAIIGGLAIILFIIFGAPRLKQQFATSPASDGAATITPVPPLTPIFTLTPVPPAPTAPIPLPSPEATQIPIESILDYLAIANYITNTLPDFKDDFSKASSSWHPLAESLPIASVIKDGELSLSLEAGTPKEKIVLQSESMTASNFALEFDFFFIAGTGGTNLGFGFPTTGGDGETTFTVNIDLENQRWSIGLADGSMEYNGEIKESLMRKWTHIQIVLFDNQVGFFLNDNFLGRAEGISHSRNEIWIDAASGGQGYIKLDNIEFWNLDHVNLGQ